MEQKIQQYFQVNRSYLEFCERKLKKRMPAYKQTHPLITIQSISYIIHLWYLCIFSFWSKIGTIVSGIRGNCWNWIYHCRSSWICTFSNTKIIMHSIQLRFVDDYLFDLCNSQQTSTEALVDQAPLQRTLSTTVIIMERTLD